MRVLLPILLFLSILQARGVEHYRVVNGCVQIDSAEYKLLRRFDFEGKGYYLAVDPWHLKTSFIDAAPIAPQECSHRYYESPYYQLLQKSALPPYPLQNDGISSGRSGLYLTTDLCPSSKEGFEEGLYRALIAKFPHPVPVALFITKRWILKHTKAFNMLKTWQEQGLLDITWGNHTAYHHYYPKVPLEKNFVLAKGEDIKKDILDLEVVLINRGVHPSIFFRFPGLVSNKAAIESVASLGLITIGSNAWLAKGQIPKEGSIILVHGNKNEPKGVENFLKMLQIGKIRELQSITKLQF